MDRDQEHAARSQPRVAGPPACPTLIILGTNATVSPLNGLSQAAAVDEMLACTAVGTADEASAYLKKFAAETGADELITVHYSDSVPNRLASVELLAGALDPAGAG